jgi:phage FluMu protein Com
MPRDSRPRRSQDRRTTVVAKMVAAGDQCRCHCGSMLARVVAQGLELKCRKCKSLVLITHDELVAMYQRLGLKPSPAASMPERPVR